MQGNNPYCNKNHNPSIPEHFLFLLIKQDDDMAKNIVIPIIIMIFFIAACSSNKKEIHQIEPQSDMNQMVLIPAGAFLMGSEDGANYESPVHEVYLDDFYIDVYEVTNAEYADFLNALGNQQEGGVTWLAAGDGYALIHQNAGTWQVDTGYSEYPVVAVSWFGARAYCKWRNSRLPTEAEWEKAARGGLESRLYPWGDESPVCDLVAQNGAQYGSCSGQIVPVGRFRPNGYGLYDMAGNVLEWISSLHEAYPYNEDDGRENPDPYTIYPTRGLRGGSWFDSPYYLRVASRQNGFPEGSIGSIGFRCARSP
jgi:iron(II)-dependent oxidoreductase